MDICHIQDQAKYKEGLKKATYWKFTGQIDFDHQIIIGFSPTNFHMFIICDDIEFHPHISLEQTKIIRRRREYIRAGGFFLVSGFSQKEIRELKSYLYSQVNRRFSSCHLGVFQVLKESKIPNINFPFLFRYKPSIYMNQLLNSNENDLKNNSQNCKLYLLKYSDIDSFLTKAMWFEKKFLWGYLLSDIYLVAWNLILKYFLAKNHKSILRDKVRNKMIGIK